MPCIPVFLSSTCIALFYSADRTICVGYRSQLVYYINPGTAEEDSYFYTISDPDVLSFDGKYVEGLAAGTSFITIQRVVDNVMIGSILYTVIQ